MGRRGLSLSFDLDGTLTSNRFVDRIWHEGLPGLVAQKHGISIPSAHRLCTEAYMQEGEDSILWYKLPYWFRYFGLDGQEPGGLITQYTSDIELYDDVVPVLNHLGQEGYRLMLFSNAARCFLDAEVSVSGIAPFFDGIISVSDDWGTTKADREAYSRLLGLAGGPVVHIGDHIRLDYEVPMAVGIKAYHIQREDGPSNNESLKNLKEFADLLRKEEG